MSTFPIRQQQLDEWQISVPQLLLCSLTELPGGLTAKFYHHPLSLPPPFLPPLPLPPPLPLLASSLACSALFYLIDEILKLKRFFGRQPVCVCVMCISQFWLREGLRYKGLVFRSKQN